ncbi:hypothetical protein RchiOBHm_Chr1g0324151 [Rosa chinensis]|uniref:Uncharacterized protein n=1 Tax=Rosa chinensis TaxID=74649 RepID=A0A2P6S9M8_ROSCH|nr:hypothetical protein RchiOBHm_Chr1g0324151 [Rosa chinensis]
MVSSDFYSDHPTFTPGHPVPLFSPLPIVITSAIPTITINPQLFTTAKSTTITIILPIPL